MTITAPTNHFRQQYDKIDNSWETTREKTVRSLFKRSNLDNLARDTKKHKTGWSLQNPTGDSKFVINLRIFPFKLLLVPSCYLPTCTYTTTPGLSAESQLKDLDMHMRYAHGIDDGTKTNRTQNFSKSLTNIPVDFTITQGRVKMQLLLVTRMAFLLDVPPRSQQVQVFLMWQRDIAWTKSNRRGRKSYKTEKLFPPKFHYAKQALEFFET